MGSLNGAFVPEAFHLTGGGSHPIGTLMIDPTGQGSKLQKGILTPRALIPRGIDPMGH